MCTANAHELFIGFKQGSQTSGIPWNSRILRWKFSLYQPYFYQIFPKFLKFSPIFTIFMKRYREHWFFNKGQLHYTTDIFFCYNVDMVKLVKKKTCKNKFLWTKTVFLGVLISYIQAFLHLLLHTPSSSAPLRF